MKKLLLVGTALTALFGGSALAADLRRPAYTPPPPPPPVANWTGFYIGGNLGGAWARGTVNDSLFGLSASSDRSGFIGGGQLGRQLPIQQHCSRRRVGLRLDIARRDREWPFCSGLRNSPGIGKHALDIDAGR